METETWYVMEDGSFGDPREIVTGDKGLLQHKDGRPVAYTPHGPRSRSIDSIAERKKKEKTPVEKKPEVEKEMNPDQSQKPGYKTRETKAK